MVKKMGSARFYAVLAAVLFAISAPFSKVLLGQIPPVLMAALLYLGAGFGMLTLYVIQKNGRKVEKEARITKKELPFTVAMVVLDIAAAIFLMIGLTMTTAANAALLNNFEIVATALISFMIFKEAIGKQMWIALGLITVASILLTVEDFSSFQFSTGSIFILLGCICWGVENNCTRMLSIKNPIQIVIIKGIGSGFGSLCIALLLQKYSTNWLYILAALALGFVAYGLSIYFYIRAQRDLGATRTSAFYAIAPFISVALSFIIFRHGITWTFVISLLIMIAGTVVMIREKHYHEHIHEEMDHEHRHSHADGHHNHGHDDFLIGEHNHHHEHEQLVSSHPHTPDLHHNHEH